MPKDNNIFQSLQQNVIALVWDFDQTLSSHYMQEPLFRRFGIDARQFWRESDSLVKRYLEQGIHVNKDTVYLNHMLTYVQEGLFPGLNNAALRELGAEIQFFPGMPGFLQASKEAVASDPEYHRFDIRLEHYVVSTGLSEMIRGSAVAPHLDGIWGCEFIEAPFVPSPDNLVPKPGHTGTISQIACTVDNTTKTKALFEINKGVNWHPGEIDVNQRMPEEQRRVQFRHMAYVADGPSDIPSFSLVRSQGGRTFAVYREDNDESFAQAENLLRDGRIDMHGPANYESGTHTYKWLMKQIRDAANSICEAKRSSLAASNRGTPRHL